MAKEKDIDSDYVDELRECAWIAYKGYFCCLSAKGLAEASIPSTFFESQQNNSYMCAILWWSSLFGLEAPDYQFSRNYKRDIRYICNKKKKVFQGLSGEDVDKKLMLTASISDIEYQKLRVSVRKSRNNFFAHVNPDEQIYAFSLGSCEKMFLACLDIVYEQFQCLREQYPQLITQIDQSEKIIRFRMDETKKDHDSYIGLISRSWSNSEQIITARRNKKKQFFDKVRSAFRDWKN